MKIIRLWKCMVGKQFVVVHYLCRLRKKWNIRLCWTLRRNKSTHSKYCSALHPPQKVVKPILTIKRLFFKNHQRHAPVPYLKIPTSFWSRVCFAFSHNVLLRIVSRSKPASCILSSRLSPCSQSGVDPSHSMRPTLSRNSSPDPA